MAKIQDIDIPYLEFGEAAAPGTPAAAVSRLYVKADGLFYSKDDAGVETLMSGGGAGAVATDAIWDAAGDLVQGTGANTGAKLTAGSAGMTLKSAGAAAANLWAYPPGYEFNYVQFTSNVSITATTAASANTVIAGSSVAYDGSTIVYIEFYCVAGQAGTSDVSFSLWDEGPTDLGRIAYVSPASTYSPIRVGRRLTPSAASHTYTIKGYVTGGTGTAIASTGGAGTNMPGYIRITKV